MKLKTKLGILLISISSVMLYVGCSSSDSSTSVSEENGSSTQEGNGIFIDPRDGQSYKTVVIGNQEWMAENMNYETGGSYCYNDSTENCEKYGRLYTWVTANYVCPEGWFLPKKWEFETLMSNVRGKEFAGRMLKSTTGWKDDDGESGNGIDAFGFNVLPAGIHDSDGNFFYAGEDAYFWSATEDDEDYAYGLYLNYHYESASLYLSSKDLAGSVRCLRGFNSSVKDSSSSESEESGTFTDTRDGQIYKTVKIEEQVWMAENLNYETENSYCYNDSTENCEKYGRLYTWVTANCVCPEGWFLPTAEEFETLMSNVGGSDVAGKMLKSTTGWKDDDGESGNGVDAFGFNVLPAGSRRNGYFGLAGYSANFWSATGHGENSAYYLGLGYLYEDADLDYDNRGVARSVRCIRGSN